MYNKIKHYNATQSIPDAEFLPLLRGESPYYGNLNRPAQSAFALAETVSEIQSWGGTVSILQQEDQMHSFSLYEIARITDTETLTAATYNDDQYSRYGIVVAEAEFDTVTQTNKNVVVCTFCPNFIYPSLPTWTSETNNSKLYLYTTSADGTFLGIPSYFLPATIPAGDGKIRDKALAVKTGPKSIFFSGTARIFG